MKSKKLHLSLLMFFQLCTNGAYIPVLSLYLKNYLNFSGMQIGLILSMAAIPSIVAPFFSSWIVDRLITSRKFLALSHIVGGIVIFILSFETSYFTVLSTYFIYMIFFIPTYPLVNALIFHNMENSDNYGFIRLWGTVGWVFVSFIVGLLMRFSNAETYGPSIFRISSVASIFVIFLTLKLPKLSLDRSKKVSILPKEAYSVIKQPHVLIIYILVFICSTSDKFISYGLSMFIGFSGVKSSNIIMILSLSQISEIVMLFSLGAIIKRMGLKNIFIIALALQIFRYFTFYMGSSLALTILGILSHGFIYAMFYTGASIYLDKCSDKESRGGVHQIYTLAQAGLSALLGNLAAGYFAENYTINNTINFKVFWAIPFITSIITLFILIIGVKRLTNSRKVP